MDKSLQKIKESLPRPKYRIACEGGTEAPFHNEYWNNEKPGIYVDIVSGEPLFASNDKFESDTGWPSFTRPINKDEILEKKDLNAGLERTEVRSKKGDIHLGHVFDDGPGPTGLRYCVNSASLKFIPVEEMKNKGYGRYLYLFDESGAEVEREPEKKSEKTLKEAIFAAGCFWGVEAYFKLIKGVKDTTAGYAGGQRKNPSYKQVCEGRTGHAEAVRVTFDPKIVSYEKLLEHFWKMHDPTSLDRQGNDTGSQYRSIIFYHGEAQKEAAEKSKKELEKSRVYKKEIVTEIIPAGDFYPAEDYHQDYLDKNPGGYCHVNLGLAKK